MKITEQQYFDYENKIYKFTEVSRSRIIRIKNQLKNDELNLIELKQFKNELDRALYGSVIVTNGGEYQELNSDESHLSSEIRHLQRVRDMETNQLEKESFEKRIATKEAELAMVQAEIKRLDDQYLSISDDYRNTIMKIRKLEQEIINKRRLLKKYEKGLIRALGDLDRVSKTRKASKKTLQKKYIQII